MMMHVLRLKQLAGLAFVGAALSGCGNSGPTEEQLFAKYKLNEADQSAFKACDKTMGSVQPIIKISNKDQMMKSVPSEICACQAKTMSAVFVEDSYMSFAGFSNYLGKPKKEKLPRMSKIDLKPGLMSESAVKRLLVSFDSCARQYLAAHETTGELEGFLLPPPEPKKSKKELQDEKKKAKEKAITEKLKKQAAAD
jgi:hypothetical protein